MPGQCNDNEQSFRVKNRTDKPLTWGGASAKLEKENCSTKCNEEWIFYHDDSSLPLCRHATKNIKEFLLNFTGIKQ